MNEENKPSVNEIQNNNHKCFLQTKETDYFIEPALRSKVL
jgi:hypothetical protein